MLKNPVYTGLLPKIYFSRPIIEGVTLLRSLASSAKAQ